VEGRSAKCGGAPDFFGDDGAKKKCGGDGAGDLRGPIGDGFDCGDAFGDPETMVTAGLKWPPEM